MKKIKGIALSLLPLVFALLIFAVPTAVRAIEGTNTRVMDRNDLLSSSDELRIYDAAREAESLTGIIFLVAVYDGNYGIPSGSDTVSDFGFSASADDVVLLIIERDPYGVYYYEMFTYGLAHRSISDNEANRILDNSRVYNNIKGGNLTDGAVAFIEKTVNELGGGSSIGGSYDSEQIAVIVGISLAAGIISVVAVIIAYKTKLKSPIYPLSQFTNLELTGHSDVFIGKTVTRTKIESSSSGSSSGGRSGGGGGGSRGRR